MTKICANSIVVCAMVFFSSIVVMAAPDGFSPPAQGPKFTPHVAKPALQTRPVISPSLGQQSAVSTHRYIAITKNKARRQGVVTAGGTRWNCKGNRCTTNAAWPRPTVQKCQALARMVGGIQSYGVRGISLKSKGIKRCNIGVVATVRNNQLAPKRIVVKAPVLAPSRIARTISKPLRLSPSVGKPPVVRQGGFTPPKRPLHSSQTGNIPAKMKEGKYRSMPLEKQTMVLLNNIQKKKEADLKLMRIPMERLLLAKGLNPLQLKPAFMMLPSGLLDTRN